jgi:hypothetical protein
VDASDESPALKEVVAREGVSALAFVPLMTDGPLIASSWPYAIHCDVRNHKVVRGEFFMRALPSRITRFPAATAGA